MYTEIIPMEKYFKHKERRFSLEMVKTSRINGSIYATAYFFLGLQKKLIRGEGKGVFEAWWLLQRWGEGELCVWGLRGVLSL